MRILDVLSFCFLSPFISAPPSLGAFPAKEEGSPSKSKPYDADSISSNGGGSNSDKGGGRITTAEPTASHRDAAANKGCAPRWHARITRKGEELFYKLGHLLALSPKMTVLIAFLCVSLCAFGFVNFRVESDCENNFLEERAGSPLPLLVLMASVFRRCRRRSRRRDVAVAVVGCGGCSFLVATVIAVEVV